MGLYPIVFHYEDNCLSRSPRSISELNFMGLYPIVFHYKDNSTVYPDPLDPTVYDVHLVLMFPSTLYMLGLSTG